MTQIRQILETNLQYWHWYQLLPTTKWAQIFNASCWYSEHLLKNNLFANNVWSCFI